MKNYLFKKIPRLKFQLQHPTVKICVKISLTVSLQLKSCQHLKKGFSHSKIAGSGFKFLRIKLKKAYFFHLF